MRHRQNDLSWRKRNSARCHRRKRPGGGFPIGAIWIAPEHGELFSPARTGPHLAVIPSFSSGKAVLDILEEEQLLKKVQRQAPAWHQELEQLKTAYPNKFTP